MGRLGGVMENSQKRMGQGKEKAGGGAVPFSLSPSDTTAENHVR